ncbi:hypothetical protein [Sphingomonas sp. UYP23]
MFIRRYGSKETQGFDIALQHVVTARHIGGGYLITDSQGETHSVSDNEWDFTLETTLVSMMPAQPGTHFLERISEEDGSEIVGRQTVIGWGVYADGVTRPIVLDAEALHSKTWAIEMPNGRVESNSTSQWRDAEAWLSKTEG